MVERKGKESLNEEVEWRPLYGGAPGGKFKCPLKVPSKASKPP